MLYRRSLLIAASAVWSYLYAQAPVTQPVITEDVAPLEVVNPIAHDGHKGLGVLRKPPGNGPFPAVIYLHGGMTTMPLASLQSTALHGANPSRLLAGGYVVIVPTYRSRDVDPQSPVSLDDVLAVIEYARKLSYVRADSIVVFGCSGGGDLALQVPTRTKVAAVIAEEPASMMMAGMFHNRLPKIRERYAPDDSFFLMVNPRQHYTPEFQAILRAKVAKIDCPVLIIQGDVDREEIPINRFNAEILVPELRAAKKTLDVRTYTGQRHCFCASSGVPRPSGRPTPPTGPPAALEAYQAMASFCGQHLQFQPRPMDAKLMTHAPVKTSW